ncbi:MAG: DNA polymerase I [Oscillospiraceae bacterium]
MKLLAVDGNSILNRAYYGIKLLSTKDGLYTNGIYGFLNILLKIQQEVGPEAIAVAFDMRAPTFRHKRYEGYKAQRKGMPEELAQQLPILQELLGNLGYKIVMQEGWEADDILGTLAAACREKGAECVIATGDRDSFQLVGDGVTVRLAYTKGGRPQEDIIDTEAVREKYGVEPKALIDVKALMGDASDNIPGVAGVGEKTALSLITQYGTLDYIYEHLAELDIRDSLRAKLEAGKESAYMSRELAEIDCAAPVETDPSAYIKTQADNAAAYRLMAKLELFSLMERFGVRPPSEVEELAGADGTGAAEKEAALDIQFNQLPPGVLERREPIHVLFAMADGVVTALCLVEGRTLCYFDTDVEETAKAILTATVPKRTNHLKELWHYAIDHGYALQNVVFDAEIAAYILNATANDYGLERLMGEYGVAPVGLDDFTAQSFPLLVPAAGFEALCGKLSEKIEENSQQKLLTDIELPLAEVLAGMEHAGIAVDTDGIRTYGERIEEDLLRAQDNIYKLAGEEFNINSPKQLGVILFEKLGLPTGKKTKTGYSTNVDVLEGLRDKHEIVAEILEFRKLSKLKSTYVDGLLAVVGEDGRIHTTFQQTLTRTGRISSTEPNLQNIPIRTELGSELRRYFVAKEGSLLLDADYSQIELRVLADIADDKHMIEAFEQEDDIHTRTAAQVMGLPPELVTPKMRSRAKAVNFGIVYGIGAFSLSQDIGVSVHEADEYIKGYLRYYDGVEKYMERIIAEATEQGYVTTMFGRRRYLPELASSNRNLREFGKRVARNTPIQGTAADIIKIAMIKVYNRLREEKLEAKLILQVHDELIVECPPEEQEVAAKIVKEEMEHAAKLDVPLVADVGAGPNWLEAK